MNSEEQSCFCRHILQSRSLQSMEGVRQKVEGSKRINVGEIDDIETEVKIREKGEQLYKLLRELPEEDISVFALWKCIFSAFNCPILICFTLVQLEMLCKLGIALAMRSVFYSIQQDSKMKYVYTAILTLIFILNSLFSQNSWRLIENLSIEIKGALVYGLQQKIINHPAFSLKSQAIGSISDAVTELHDTLQNQSKFILMCLAAPLPLIGLSAFMVWIVGWFSLIGIGLTILCEFLHYHYASGHSQYLTQALKLKDKRMDLLFQIISAFRYIKMQLWQEFIAEKLFSIRQGEKSRYIKYGGGTSLEVALSQGVSTASMLIILGLTVKFASEITSVDIILVVLGILQIKLLTIFTSLGIMCFYQVKVALNKIVQIWQIKSPKKMVPISASSQPLSEAKQHQLSTSQSSAVICLRSVSVADKEVVSNSDLLLKNISLQIKKGQFIGVYGPSGSPKSAFLRLLASQVPFVSGYVRIGQEVAFADEVPTVFSETIRDNILIGKEMNEEIYAKAIEASCLVSDLAIFADKDLTKVEEDGVNLSGGQKTRLNLARCIYANRPILVLNDPLASVDTLVAKQLVKNFQNLAKQGKTIILMSHQISYFNQFERIFMIDGDCVRQANEEDLKKIVVEESEQSQDQPYAPNEEFQTFKQLQITTKQISMKPQAEEKGRSHDEVSYEEDSGITWSFWRAFLSYIFINKWNYLVFALSALCYLISEILYALVILLLNQYDIIRSGGTSVVGGSTQFWLVLGFMSLSVFIFQLCRTFFLNIGIQLSNEALLKNGMKKYLSLRILQADKLKGQYILGRFSTDLGLLDLGLLPEIGLYFIIFTLTLIQSLVIVIYHPILLCFAAGVLIPIFFWNRYCSLIVNILKMLDLLLKAPILTQFSQAVKGLMQIDILDGKRYITERFLSKLMSSIRASLSYRRVFRVYMSYTAYTIVLMLSGAYFVMVAKTDSSNIDRFTFAAVFLVQIQNALPYVFYGSVKITSILTSVQRMKSFEKMTQQQVKTDATATKQKPNIRQDHAYSTSQKQLNLDQHNLMNQSPSYAISIKDATIKYSAELQPAIKGISLNIRKGEKIALIGRTGCGKSTILNLLFRLVQPQPGTSYFIGHDDALKLPLGKLRSKFACIPQNPFVLSGSLRSNLDPFGEFTSEKIIESLEAVNIWTKMREVMSQVTQMAITLDSELDQLLSTFSIYEKQLISMARTILQDKQIIILDESTSNLDLETDKAIQKLIRERFKTKTIITVAHRLQTVADYDKIVVLSKGKISEIGSPKELYLLRRQFYNMVNSSSFNKKLVFEAMDPLGEFMTAKTIPI